MVMGYPVQEGCPSTCSNLILYSLFRSFPFRDLPEFLLVFAQLYSCKWGLLICLTTVHQKSIYFNILIPYHVTFLNYLIFLISCFKSVSYLLTYKVSFLQICTLIFLLSKVCHSSWLWVFFLFFLHCFGDDVSGMETLKCEESPGLVVFCKNFGQAYLISFAHFLGKRRLIRYHDLS